LLEHNEYVLTGIRVSEDTVAFLGTVESFEKDVEYYLLEYGFWCCDVYQTDPVETPDTVIFVWHLGTIHENGWRNGLLADDNTFELVYGNRLESAGDVVNLLRPSIPRSFDEFLAELDGSQPRRNYFSSKLTLGDRLIQDTTLERRLQASRQHGPVLYGTDFLYTTNSQFHDGELQYMDSLTRVIRYMDPIEYFEALDSLTKGKRKPRTGSAGDTDSNNLAYSFDIPRRLLGAHIGPVSRGLMASNDQRIGKITRRSVDE